MIEKITKTLKKGTVVKIAGIPVKLEKDVEVLTTSGNWKLINKNKK